MEIPRFSVYVKPGCPWCVEGVDWLNERGYAFEEIDVYSDRAAFAKMQHLSGQTRCPTLTANGKMLSDFDTGQLEKFLRENGWLKAA